MRIARFFRVAGGVLVVLGLPLAAIGLSVVKSNAQISVAAGAPRFLVVLVLFLLLWAVVVLSSFLHRTLVGVVTCISLGFAVASAGTAVELAHLERHGRTTSCAVLDVERRVETHVHTNADGTQSREISIYHDHRLDCAGKGHVEMTLRRQLAPARQRVDLTFDPGNRLDPVPAASVGQWEGKRTTAVVLLVLTMLVRLADYLARALSSPASPARPSRPAAPAGRTVPRHAATPRGRQGPRR